MKVFQINTVLNGSTGKIARGIYEIAKQNGIEGRIAYSRGPVIDNPDFIKFGSKLGVYVHGMLARVFDTVGLHSSFTTKKLIREIENFNPDIIHLHNLHGYYLNYKMLLKYIAAKNIKTIYTLHDCWSFTGHCAYFDMAGCEKWKSECRNCPNKKAYPSSLLFDRSRKNHQLKRKLFEEIRDLTIVTPSNWLAGLVKESFLNKFDVEVIHNGIDLNVFKPIESDFRKTYGLESKKILLGVANVWDKRKGIDDFIELRKNLNSDYAIVLIGLTQKQISCLPDGIIGITRTESAQELAEIYTAADVFVNPTYEDNFPTVNLEAIACGTPVITYNTGGSPECIDKTCGIVVPKGNVLDLSEVLRSGKLSKSSEGGESRIRSESFDELSKFNAYVNLYTQKQEKTYEIKD